MATRRLLTRFLLLCVAAVLPASASSLVKGPTSYRAAGVFMLAEGGRYTLNFTAAKAACQLLNVTIATRAQMELALHQGLETCKFGWIHEKFVVVPRAKSDQNCGKGRTGLVPWFVKEDREFAVYCFNASDLEGSPKTSTVLRRTSTAPTAQTRALASAPIASRRPAPLPVTSAKSAFALLVTATRSAASPVSAPSTRTPTSPPVVTPEPDVEETPENATVDPRTSTRAHAPTSAPITSTYPTSVPAEFAKQTSAFALPVTATRSVGPPPAAPSVDTPSTRTPTSPPVVTSEPGVVTVRATVHEPNASETVFPRSVISAVRSLGGLGLGLGLVLLLAAAATAFYHKRSVFRSCRSKRSGDAETEMWTHTDGEMEPHCRPGGDEEEELDRKFSSDVQLLVDPGVKTNTSDQLYDA